MHTDRCGNNRGQKCHAKESRKKKINKSSVYHCTVEDVE